MEEKLYLYYSNDLHSQFDNWSKMVHYFQKQKQQRIKEGNESWLIDIGDHVDRCHPIAEAHLGKANVELLNDANYDLVTIGNNEGITLDYQDLYHLYDEANFEVICGNLKSIGDDNPAWLKTSTIMESSNGVKIGFLGLTAPFNAFYNLLGWEVESPFEVLEQEILEIKEKCDIIVFLSHLGINDDEEIARRFKDIDVIVGGHTHHLFKNGEYVDGTLLTAAGKHGNYVGEIILTWDHDEKKLIKKEAYATSIEFSDRDVITENKLEGFKASAKEKLSETVVTLESPLLADWYTVTPIMEALTEDLRRWTNADIGMLNAGVLLESFQKGNVTLADVHRICPHPINPCTVELTGQEITEIIRASLEPKLTHMKLQGFGFRGKVIGKIIFSGIHVALKEVENDQIFIHHIYVDGKPLDSQKKYLLATGDMFTFGRMFPEISRSENKKYFMPEFLRDILASTLVKF
ncbi:bifunctional metallophosphatase/5'-nucleotidase [Saliterribacillus persicus]|uniref:2',3'-cyclic-nucleotide 2'-phosphodiesterase (5'-nucleotidase family) n=1 Tax=Saliterribacillus persicus TaxID=930114 RepID=A0A368XH91_9BACI|nr:bifunctional UDP-sugar hydrolase/5'-nucleotidase [Saliterribacillus persicus]RCW66969.1 2',3'-cyclic-nucleotide 2'-phosphodiesterase (5'-nucleotidase family) [Saliterribacillus persicus]